MADDGEVKKRRIIEDDDEEAAAPAASTNRATCDATNQGVKEEFSPELLRMCAR